jgi:hypothetical protein
MGLSAEWFLRVIANESNRHNIVLVGGIHGGTDLHLLVSAWPASSFAAVTVEHMVSQCGCEGRCLVADSLHLGH